MLLVKGNIQARQEAPLVSKRIGLYPPLAGDGQGKGWLRDRLRAADLRRGHCRAGLRVGRPVPWGPRPGLLLEACTVGKLARAKFTSSCAMPIIVRSIAKLNGIYVSCLCVVDFRRFGVEVSRNAERR